MASPIISKQTSAVNHIGPGGSAAAVTFSGYTAKVCDITFINDGADPVNYFVNVDPAALPAFSADSFTLKINESITHRTHGLSNIFMICAGGTTASVRYVVDLIPGTQKNY